MASVTLPSSTVSMPTKEATNSSAGWLITASQGPTWTIRPCRMTTRESARRRASIWSWVAMTAVVRVFLRTRARSSISASRVGGSRAEKGSSRSSSSGRRAKARARLVRWASPPESFRAERSSRWPMPKSWAVSAMRISRSTFGTPWSFRPEARFARTVASKSRGSWNTRVTLRR